jgi:hypothetical protein
VFSQRFSTARVVSGRSGVTAALRTDAEGDYVAGRVRKGIGRR